MFKIMGTYKGRTEELDTADTFGEASYMAGEYRLAFGPGWSIRIEAEASAVLASRPMF